MVAFFLLITLLLSSCAPFSTSTIQPQKLTSSEVSEDINRLKVLLQQRHYDLDWEGRKDVILRKLDKVASNNSIENQQQLRKKLKPIINSIDDTHTRVITKRKYRNIFTTDKVDFRIKILDDSILYMKIPNFQNTFLLRLAMIKAATLYVKEDISHILIDFNGNRGGKYLNVKYFLSFFGENIVFDNVQRIKVSTDGRPTIILNPLMKLRYIVYGFSINDGYALKKQILRKNQIVFDSDVIVLTDKNIISGSMLATFHLQESGAIIIGKKTKSLFNTFGNIELNVLPNSQIAFTIATARVIVNENYKDRSSDILIPDYTLDRNESIRKQVYNVISER